MATITGTAAGETLTGTRAQDDIFGLGGHDTIRGRGGNDTIDGGTENDLLIGRTGSDNYLVDSELDKVVERLGEGDSDTVFATISFTLRRNIENLELRGEAVRGYGNDLDNRLTVEEGQMVDNVLNGRGGADFMSGGRGRDIYYVDDAGDVVDEIGDNEDDTVRSTISLDIGQFDKLAIDTFVENLFLLGSADIDGAGGGVQNRIVGNSGDNEIRGMQGADVLQGRDGNDSLYGGVDSGMDVLIGGEGQDGFYFEQYATIPYRDIINDFTAADDTIYLDRSDFTEMPLGELPESAFVRGSVPQDADDRILYDSDTGQIRYDPDGTGEQEAAFFAVVAPGTVLNANDFVGYGG